MGGFGHHDWTSPGLSPRFLSSSVMKEDIPRENIDSNSNPVHFLSHGDLNKVKNGVGVAENDDELGLGLGKKRRGGLLERIAARAGFNAPRLDTVSMKPSDLSISQEVTSPYLTIPPGLSPTTLLESPVFLSNSLVQPSPTTGKFLFASMDANNRNSSFASQASDIKEDDQFLENFGSQPFSFKPVVESGTAHFHGHENRGTENSLQPQNGVASHIPMEFWRPSSNSIMPSGKNSLWIDDEEDEKGYTWRRYGHKQVKGSEYPRSYYKCMHPNCTMKKKVERSHDAVVMEVIYKGSHNHPEPITDLSHRSSVAIGLDDRNNSTQSLRGLDDPNNLTQSLHDSNSTPDWKVEDNHVEAMSALENAGNNNSLEAQKGGSLHDSSVDVDVDVDGSDEEGSETSKRRKLEEAAAAAYTRAGAVREPKVVVQTTSEVDILDDGYRWRKYGQKVVKGNPNPRSYYKCTSAGCTVRKHVERASHDLGSVITAYEGKHNHQVPAARNNTHSINSSMTSLHHLHRITDSSQLQMEMPRFHNRPAEAAAAPVGSCSYGLGRRQMMSCYGSLNQSLGSMRGGGRQGNMMPMRMPKGDPKLEAISDQHPITTNMNNNTNNDIYIGYNGSSIYHQIMSTLPTHAGPKM